jgi:cellulose synthase/poly-beta-1,6-N-acetylglucosamine synthase-like glycosyltransferase
LKSPLDPFVAIPAPHANCRLTVVIPARDEAAYVGRTIDALCNQRDLDGSLFAPERFDVLVYANNCVDDTVAIVRAVADAYPRHTVHVAEESLPPNVAHIGTARRAAMNAASARFAAAGITDAVLVATDADSISSPVWLAWTLREMQHADVVTGRITVDRDEWRALSTPTRAMLRAEDTYQFAVARLGALLDPKPHDPWPRHWQRSGPSLAVRLAAYDAVGGVPPVRTLEDIALYDALERHGARIRHSLRVRVTTSARLQSRAPGGFGTRIRTWDETADEQRRLLVEDPDITIARLRGEDTGSPSERTAYVPAAEATAVLRQVIARGVSADRATRSKVESIAG